MTKQNAIWVYSPGQASKTDLVEGVRVGDEPVPGVRLRHICRGHKGSIGRIVWSPCGQFIASPSSDKTIRIWDTNSGNCLAVLEGHDSVVTCVAWSTNGEIIATAGSDETIRFWDTKTFTCKKTCHSFGRLHVGEITSLGWSSDSKLVAAIGSSPNLVFVVDTSKHLSIHAAVLNDHPCYITNECEFAGWAIGFTDGHISIFNWDSHFLEAQHLRGHSNSVSALAWSRDGKLLASGSLDNTIGLWNLVNNKGAILEGHNASVISVSLGPDQSLVASKSFDGTVRVWDVDKRYEVAQIAESAETPGGIAFHPHQQLLATQGENSKVIRIWDLDKQVLLGIERASAVIRYTSAKIVLVGESNVGKSCLAMRVAEDRYPEDHEHGTTHGMRFWQIEAENLHPSAKPPEGHRRDVVFWDFGGQDEYQLVHQMFLHDTTLALVLIDPTRGRVAIDEARHWHKRLEKNLKGRKAVKLLVGAKQDHPSPLVNNKQIKDVCDECGYSAYLETSAKTSFGVDNLKAAIEEFLDWDSMSKTSRPELFQRIRDEVDLRREAGDVVVLLTDMKSSIRENRLLAHEPKRASTRRIWEIWKKKAEEIAQPRDMLSMPFDDTALEAVTDQLATQGVIVKTRLTSGEQAVVFQLPVIEQYAGAIIVAARNNPRHVPALEERLLGSEEIPLPGIKEERRLERLQEKIVLECIAELMIQHGICFRHGGLLVFPTLFPSYGVDDKELVHRVSLYYDFTGAIDNIYASLVSKLMVSGEFGEGRLSAGLVEFEQIGQGICGIRQIKRTGGLAHIDVFFSESTDSDRKDLFTHFVEEHLRLLGIDIREYQVIKCECGYEISENIIDANIKRGRSNVICPICRITTAIGEGVDRIRQRNPEIDAKMIALRKTIDVKLAEDVKSAKMAVTGDAPMTKKNEPIRILHLSDLHFTRNTNPATKLKLLLQDIRQQDEKYAEIETVEYLVVSGDMTDKGQDIGFEKARQFIEELVKELGLSFERCILVPGNHDVQDRADAYEERETEDGTTIRVRHPENFPKRFEQFSNNVFHKLMLKEYPLNYADQGISYLFSDTAIQFLTLNSAWEIDKNGRKKSGIHKDAIAGVIYRANNEQRQATDRGDLHKFHIPLRIGVWHHAVSGPEAMSNIGFLTQLKKAGVRLCLHGDVHESRADLFGYRKPGIDVEIVGAGSFGSEAEGRPESIPRLYNMLEVFVDPVTRQHLSIRVHTRAQKSSEEAWEGYYEWPNPEGTGRIPYYDIELR